MLNVKKLSDVELATLYKRLDNVFLKKENIFYKKFEDLYDILKHEINRRNRILIYHEACKHLKIGKYDNQFKCASSYADAVLNDCNYFETDSDWEMSSFHTKNGSPILITLICNWSKI